MKPHVFGVVVARAAGLVLLLIGASQTLGLLPLFNPWEPGSGATSGWTSYSPISTNQGSGAGLTSTTNLHDTYFLISNLTGAMIPSLALAGSGAVLILLSRPVGKWLLRGLSDEEPRPGSD